MNADGQLVLAAVLEEDAGEYECHPMNRYGGFATTQLITVWGRCLLHLLISLLPLFPSSSSSTSSSYSLPPPPPPPPPPSPSYFPPPPLPVLPNITFAENPVVGILDATITLTCPVTGIPNPSVSWRLPNGNTPPGNPSSISLGPPLSVANEGSYTCVATNAAGSVTQSLQLLIRGECKV